jgi:AmmeMemoRadiSam system protein A
MTRQLDNHAEFSAKPHAPNAVNEPSRPFVDAALAKTSLSEEEKRVLLQVARQTLETYLASGEQAHFHSEKPALNQMRAVFVTLWRRDTGELRGCRGESIARRPLVDAVSAMAIAAAADDPRFFPVTPEELPKLRIEINALTPLTPVRPSEVEVGRHGLLIVRGGAAGLLLPEVPVRFRWNRQQFLEGVCQKAGLQRDAWRRDDVELYGFESDEWGEEA